MIPHLNKTVDILLSERIDARTVNVREVIDDLRGQVDDYTAVFEAVVLMAPGRFRVTFKSSRKMEVAENSGLHIRGLPVDFVPVSQFKWVNVTRLSYGVPDEEIHRVLEAYGVIRLIKSEVYSLIYTGVRHVLMEVRENIPSRLKIAGHWCFVHYRGQKRVCFQCGKEGHQRDRCLSNLAHDLSVRTPAERPVETRTAPANDTTVAAAVPRSEGVQVPASAAVELPASGAVEVPACEVTDVPASEETPSGVAPSEVTEVPAPEVVGRLASDVREVSASEVVGGLASEAMEVASSDTVQVPSEAAAVVASIVDAVVDLPGSLADNQLSAESARPATGFRTPVPVRSQTSKVGEKRQRSRSRSKSSSPVNKDRRREASPDLENTQADINLQVTSGSVTLTPMPDNLEELPAFPSDEEAGSLSDTSLGFHSGDVTALEELLDTYHGTLTSDSPLTQVTPNLPCDTQERVQRSRPETSQLSDESRVIARFFGDTSSSDEEGEH